MSDEPKAMPSSIMAEKAVLSCMMKTLSLHTRGKADGIDADCFWHPTNKILFAAINTLGRDDNGEIDLITLVQYLQDNGELDKAGGASAVYDVFGYSTTASGWSSWCDSLREMKARRLAITASTMLSEASDSGEAILTAKNALEALTRAVSGQKRSINGKQAIGDFIEKFKINHEAGDIPGYSTGIQVLDQISGGMRGGELWIAAGKPSRGKSVLIIQIACEFIENGLPVALFSIEMTANEIIGRIISVIGRINYGVITQPRLATKSDLQKIARVSEMIISSKLFIDASANQTMRTIEAEAQRIKDLNNGELAFVGIDYIQIVRPNDKSSKSREEEVAQTSGGMKQLAKQLNCPVMSATQLNEQNQTRESRAIEQDADALLFICDDGIKIGKLRNGQRDSVLNLTLDGSIQRFK